MSRERLSNIDTLMLRVEDPVQPNVGMIGRRLDGTVNIAGFQAEFDALLALALEKTPPTTELSARLDDALATLDENLTA